MAMILGFDAARIERQFSRSLRTYNEYAGVQRMMAKELLSLIEQQDCRSKRFLEIGAGTGLFTQMLVERFAPSSLALNDLSAGAQSYLDGFISACGGQFYGGDFLQVQLGQDTSFDVVASSATFQWMPDIDALFAKISGLLPVGGILAFSTFCGRTLTELFSALDITPPEYPSEEALLLALENWGLGVEVLKSELIKAYYPSPLDLLKTLKRTGANAFAADFSFNKKTLRAFEQRYSSYFYSEEGVYATYNPVYIVAVKRAAYPTLETPTEVVAKENAEG